MNENKSSLLTQSAEEHQIAGVWIGYAASIIGIIVAILLASQTSNIRAIIFVVIATIPLIPIGYKIWQMGLRGSKFWKSLMNLKMFLLIYFVSLITSAVLLFDLLTYFSDTFSVIQTWFGHYTEVPNTVSAFVFLLVFTSFAITIAIYRSKRLLRRQFEKDKSSMNRVADERDQRNNKEIFSLQDKLSEKNQLLNRFATEILELHHFPKCNHKSYAA